MTNIIEKFEKYLSDAKLEQAEIDTAALFEVFRLKWLGKEGFVKLAFQELKQVSAEYKVDAASKLNILKPELEEFIKIKSAFFESEKLNKKLQSEFIDGSLPGFSAGFGSIHPVVKVERIITEILSGFGLRSVHGPEVETEYYCFDSLNIPKHHPARDMQDTFYTDTNCVLRTHTTSVQARVLDERKLPVKIISAGRVYRNESEDSSHQAMFHQYELIWIDKGLNLSHLMGIIKHVLQKLYGPSCKVRFVSKFYPYTCPSVGAQISCSICNAEGCSACKGAGWVTIIGSGVVHEKVLKEFGYDPSEVSGIAFGFGTSRLAGQFYKAPSLKTLYDNDLRYLRAV